MLSAARAAAGGSIAGACLTEQSGAPQLAEERFREPCSFAADRVRPATMVVPLSPREQGARTAGAVLV
jgi:hypothetical protein